MAASNVCGITLDLFTQGTTAAGAAKTLTIENNRLVLLDTVLGSVVTLPAATGTGAKYRFVVSVLATSPNHVVKVANTTDVMQGVITLAGVGGLTMTFSAAATHDTITLNRTTSGGTIIGEYFDVQDLASGIWQVNGQLNSGTATPVTPFSATV